MSYITIAARIRAKIRCCINDASINKCRHEDTSEDSDEISHKNTKESGEKKNL